MLYGGNLEDFYPSPDIIGSLTAPDIEFVLSRSCKPGPIGLIVQMADAEVLLYNMGQLQELLKRQPIIDLVLQFGV